MMLSGLTFLDMVFLTIMDNFDNDNDNKTCRLWDIDYNSDNREPEFMTIFVTWQLRVTLDRIRNSCDVFYIGQG